MQVDSLHVVIQQFRLIDVLPCLTLIFRVALHKLAEGLAEGREHRGSYMGGIFHIASNETYDIH